MPWLELLRKILADFPAGFFLRVGRAEIGHSSNTPRFALCRVTLKTWNISKI